MFEKSNVTIKFLLFFENADVVGNDETRTRNCTVREPYDLNEVTERPRARNLVQCHAEELPMISL